MSFLDFLFIGLIAGISPGPITALMLGETFRHGVRKGIQVPLALIVSNFFFAVFSVTLVYLSSSIDSALVLLKYLGGLVLIWMGTQEWRASGKLELKESSRPFLKTLLIEVPNPHPYIFWFTVLAPSMVVALKAGAGMEKIVLFWACFVVTLVGSKMAIVLAAHNIKHYLTDSYIRIILRILAVLLILFGIKVLFS